MDGTRGCQEKDTIYGICLLGTTTYGIFTPCYWGVDSFSDGD